MAPAFPMIVAGLIVGLPLCGKTLPNSSVPLRLENEERPSVLLRSLRALKSRPDSVCSSNFTVSEVSV